MRFLRRFNESEDITIYDERIREFFPSEVHLYTSEGSFILKKSDITLENDIIRAFYYQNTAEDGNVAKDGEPDTLAFDMHFVKNENGFKILVNITYGDQMKSEFSIEAPNEVSIGHYNGIGSVADKHTHFGFEKKTIDELVKLFNSFNFGYKLTNDDFNFIDKYPDTYLHKNESIKLMPLSNGRKILVINNSGSEDNRYLNNIVNYLRMRGIDYEVVSSIEEIPDFNNFIGAISTGSDFRITRSDSEARLAFEVYKNLDAPILGICYGFQAMVKFYNGTLKDSGEFIHKHLKLTKANTNHSLFKDIDLSNIEFSFSFHDMIEKDPEGFKQIAMLEDIIVGISDDKRQRYGLLFHPEDKEMSFPVLDNFIRMCSGEVDEQEKLKMGQFEHLVNFKNFIN
jgi:GMP synthase-like glutamine amidotransferase